MRESLHFGFLHLWDDQRSAYGARQAKAGRIGRPASDTNLLDFGDHVLGWQACRQQ